MAKSNVVEMDKFERNRRLSQRLERAVRESEHAQRNNRLGAKNWQSFSDEDADEIVDQAQRWLASRR